MYAWGGPLHGGGRRHHRRTHRRRRRHGHARLQQDPRASEDQRGIAGWLDSFDAPNPPGPVRPTVHIPVDLARRELSDLRHRQAPRAPKWSTWCAAALGLGPMADRKTAQAHRSGPVHPPLRGGVLQQAVGSRTLHRPSAIRDIRLDERRSISIGAGFGTGTP